MSHLVQDSQTTPLVPNYEEDEIDLGDLVGVIIENRVLILAVTGLFLLFGLGYTFVATPIYQADALIQVEEKKSGLGDLDINALFEGDASVSAEIEILRSRMVLGTVVDNLALNIVTQPDFFPVFGAALSRRLPAGQRKRVSVDTLELPDSLVGETLTLVAGANNDYEVVGPDGETLILAEVGSVGKASFRGQPVSIFISELHAKVGDEFRLEGQSKLKTIERIKTSLSINEKGKSSGILAIALQGVDPVLVAQEVNEIVNVYIRQNVERKSAEAEKTLAFLEEQLPVVKQDMETAEAALNSYRLEKGSIDLPLETQAILESIVTIEGQLNGLMQERDKVLQGFTTAHPMVLALDKQIERLEGELAELNAQVRELPNTQQEVLRLVRDAEVNTVLYTSLLNTAQELRVVKAGTVGNARVVDYAVPPYEPIAPKPGFTIVVSILLGICIGFIVSIIRKLVHNGIVDPDLVEKYLDVPVHATVLKSKRQIQLSKSRKVESRSKPILAVDSPDDLAIESIRGLRTALHFGLTRSKSKSMLVAGPSPGIGKSFISLNLAVVLAEAGKSVLLVDGDLRRGQLHKQFGLSRVSGLSELLGGKIPMDSALRTTDIEGLEFIPTGALPAHPAELLLGSRLRRFLSVACDRFDHVILDTPPLLAVTDGVIIGRAAGAMLMVVASGKHSRNELIRCAKKIRQSGINLQGAVLNDVVPSYLQYGAGKYGGQYLYKQGQ